MSTTEKTSKKRPSVRQSMEVKHGTQGIGRMLRRGLHGAKNWVLEPDEDGTHRTVGSKAFRTAVALAPAWIVASAFTGSPKNEGQQIGVFQALFMAVLVTMLMLAFFSARERRLGREEPWTEEASAEPEPSGEEVEPGPEQVFPQPSEGVLTPGPEGAEKPAVDLEKPQVREVTTEVTTEASGHNEDEKDHFELPEPVLVTPVVTEAVTQTFPTMGQDEVFDQVSDQVTAPEEVVTEAVTHVVTQPEIGIENHPIADIVEEEAPTVRLGGGHLEEEVVTQTPEKQVNPQVNEGDQVVTREPEKAPRISLEKASKEKAPDPEPPLVTQPVTPVVTKGTQEPLFPQVKKPEPVVTQAVTPAVTQPSMATVGPYKPTTSPLTEDWWATSPDVPKAEGAEVSVGAVQTDEEVVEPEPEKDASTSLKSLKESPAEEDAEREDITEEDVEDPQESGEAESQMDTADITPPHEVMLYRTIGQSKTAPKEARRRARQSAVAWVQREYEAKRVTQRQAAEMFNVSKSLIVKWLEDPWSAPEDDESV